MNMRFFSRRRMATKFLESNLLISEQRPRTDCITLANKLINICQIKSPRVSDVLQIDAKLIEELFVKLCDVRLPEIIPNAESVEDRVHNIQAIIDSLSLDVLHISLSHITGEDVVSGDVEAICNLLEIMHGYYEYLVCCDDLSDSFQIDVADRGFDVRPSNEISHRSMEYPSTASSIHPLDPGTDLKSSTTIPATENFVGIGERYDPPIISRGSPGVKNIFGGTFTHHLYHHHQCHEVAPSARSVAKEAQQIVKDDRNKTSPLKSNDTEFAADAKLEERGIRTGDGLVKTYADNSKSGRRLERCRLHSRSMDDIYRKSNEQYSKPSPTANLNGGKHSSQSVSQNDLRRIPRATRNNANYLRPNAVNLQDLNELYLKDANNLLNEKLKELRLVKQCDKDMGRQYKRATKRFIGKVSTPVHRRTLRKFATPSKKRSTVKLATSGSHAVHVRGPRVKSKTQANAEDFRASAATELAEDVDDFCKSRLIARIQSTLPGISVSPKCMRKMENDFARHVGVGAKPALSDANRKSKLVLQYEEAVRRQKLLSKILRKELEHAERMEELKVRKDEQLTMNNRIREEKIRSARVKRYQSDADLKAKSWSIDRQSRERSLFQKQFVDEIKSRKHRLRENRSEKLQRRREVEDEERDDLQQVENFYRTQFEVMMKSVAKERTELETRKKAQANVLRQMKHEYRQRVENELKILSENTKSDDDMHYRFLDINRYHRERC